MIDKLDISFEMEQQMCKDCKKTSIDYYELKLQLRFKFFNNINKIKDETINLVNKNLNFINKIDSLDHGFDIYFRNKHMLNKISNLFNDKYLVEEKRTKKIVGRNFLESKDVWRHVILINIINLKINDIIAIKGIEYKIKALNKKDLILIHIINSSKKVVSYDIIKDYLTLIKKDKNN